MPQIRNAALLGSLLLSALLPTGCRQPARLTRAVYLGPTAVYRLTDTTYERTPDAITSAAYQRRFNFHPQFNQPLHRLVTGRQPDQVYLGLVLPPLPTDLAELAASDSVWQLLERRVLPQRAVLAWLRSKHGHEWDVRFLKTSTKSKNTHVIHLLTADSATARRVYFAPVPFDGQILL